jgi:deoxyribonuclease-4
MDRMPRKPTALPVRIGLHASIAGSLERAAEQAVALGCNTFQIFSRSPRMWKSPALDPAAIERLKAARAQHDLRPMVIHGNYLTNMAAADEAIRDKSTASFRDEVQRALALGAEYLVIHPGSYKGQTLPKAIVTLADSIEKAVRGLKWDGLTLLLENTAGGGMSIGREFSELAELRALIEKKPGIPTGYCIDTAHCFEAGYDISTADGLEDTLGAIELELGLDNVSVIHTNDSKTPFGSRVDRHQHIGQGEIGARAFGRILRHPRLIGKAFILETPVEEEGDDQRNVDMLKALAQPKKRQRRDPKNRSRDRKGAGSKSKSHTRTK